VRRRKWDGTLQSTSNTDGLLYYVRWKCLNSDIDKSINWTIDHRSILDCCGQLLAAWTSCTLQTNGEDIMIIIIMMMMMMMMMINHPASLIPHNIPTLCMAIHTPQCVDSIRRARLRRQYHMPTASVTYRELSRDNNDTTTARENITGLFSCWSIVIYTHICYTSLIFMIKLNVIGANSVTCRVLEYDVLQNKCSDWLNVVFTGEHRNAITTVCFTLGATSIFLE